MTLGSLRKGRVWDILPYGVLGIVEGGISVVGVTQGGWLAGLAALISGGLMWLWTTTALWAMHVVLWPSYEEVRPWRRFIRAGAWLTAVLALRWILLLWIAPPVSPLAWVPGWEKPGYATDILWVLGFLVAWWELRDVVGEEQARGVAMGLWGLAALILLVL